MANFRLRDAQASYSPGRSEKSKAARSNSKTKETRTNIERLRRIDDNFCLVRFREEEDKTKTKTTKFLQACMLMRQMQARVC